MYSIANIPNAKPPVQVVPLTPALAAAVQRAAAGDRHGVIHPSHAVVRGADVVGYGSLGTVPMFFAWLHTQQMSAPETFRAWAQAEKILAGRGPVCMPCTADSPLLPFVEKKGYARIGTAHLFIKEL